MARRNHYNTRQKADLIDYLQSMKGEHVSVSDIHDHFARYEKSVGMTTIYRRLSELTDEGLVAKYTIDGVTGACFEYIGKESCHEGMCIHCKCEVCGAITHLHCDEFKMIGHHLQEDHGFKVNPNRTVIYGLCEKCSDKLAGESK